MTMRGRKTNFKYQRPANGLANLPAEYLTEINYNQDLFKQITTYLTQLEDKIQAN